MPRLTLMLDRNPIQVYELDRAVITIGRAQGVDILIDNVAVSRRQAEIRREGEGWIVRDLGSANGTFLNGERLTEERPLAPGDEISFGKFSLFFERVPAVPPSARPAAAPPRAAPRAGVEGTLHMSAEEVDRLQRAAAQKRQAHLQWEVPGARGTHVLEAGGALIGRSELCDLRLPAGPKHHLLILRTAHGFEARNTSWWHTMRVNGRAGARARLTSGDVIELGPIRLTFMDEVR